MLSLTHEMPKNLKSGFVNQLLDCPDRDTPNMDIFDSLTNLERTSHGHSPAQANSSLARISPAERLASDARGRASQPYSRACGHYLLVGGTTNWILLRV